MYDTIIIGMGVSGMTAAIYSARSNLNTLIIDDNAPGGLLNKVSVINNYPGYSSISGSELSFKIYEQMKNEKVDIVNTKALKIEDKNDYKIVTTTKGEYKTKTVIIAIGRKLKKSGIQNEEKFIGKGISYCAICDAPLYKDKKIVVLGSNENAFTEAQYLSRFTKDITLIPNNEISEELKNKYNINILEHKEIEKFEGNDTLEKIIFKDGSVIDTNGVFIYYGYNADTAFISSLDICDEKGYIVVNNKMETKVKNIFACGDTIKKDVYQVVTACAEGSIAALSAKDSIK